MAPLPAYSLNADHIPGQRGSLYPLGFERGRRSKELGAMAIYYEKSSSSAEPKSVLRQESSAGFSLLEMMIACSISLILAAFAVVSYVPTMKGQRSAEAYNEVLGTLRRTRDQAAADMRVYVVTFSNSTTPSSITVTQSGISGCQIPATGALLLTTQLPPDITFQVEPGAPTSNTVAPTTPDQFGTGALAIDFDYPNGGGSASMCFNPDGTVTDNAGNLSSGVVYMGRTNDTYSARAITVWGATGRIRGWRMYSVSGVNTWSQQ